MSKEELKIIDLLIDKKQNFVIYKLPNSTEWQFMMQERGEPQLFTDIEDLNGEEGYVITPFRVSKEYPIVLLKGDRDSLPSLSEAESFKQNRAVAESIQPLLRREELFTSYKEQYEKFMEPLLSGCLSKVVLSRQVQMRSEKRIAVAKAFNSACKNYPNTYVYLLHTCQTGVWMGSTPELILAGQGEDWQTVALAGTQTYPKRGDIYWDEKNLLEQDLVSQYIYMQLNKLGIIPKADGPKTIQAGSLAHLKTDFQFSLTDRSHIGNILKLLHPTPAVCGLPKELSYQFILNSEPNDRRYYSGFVGKLDPNGSTNLFVNLRCVQIHQKNYTLYAGGGLLSSSTFDKEWVETEKKMQTMHSVL